MAYEVTATRKRPQDFDHLVGQEFVVSTLRNALKSGRIAHAYLFAGPRGVGKTSTARILAKALNNPAGPGADGAFAWDGADDIAKGRSIDVIEIDGASNTSVNDVRAIKDEVLFPPQSSRYKIYIIDEVHMLSNSAFNALLKTIEEPPPYIIFIFATTELHKVPATIRSRCQQFMFRLIPLDVVRDRLAEAAGDLGVKADDEALYWIAKESTGSMRDAYTLFDQVVSFSEGHVRLEIIREKLGLVGLEQINELASLCLAGDTAGALTVLHGVMGGGVSVEQFVIDLTEYYRGLLFIQAGITRESLLGYAPERFLKEAVGGYTRGQVEKIIGILLQTYRDIRYSVDARYDLELAVARMCRMRAYVEPQDLYQRLRQLEQAARGLPADAAPKTVAGPAPATVPAAPTAAPAAAPTAPAVPTTPPSPQAVAAVSREVSEEHVHGIVQLVQSTKPTLGSVLAQVIAWRQAGDVLTLHVETRFAADTVRNDQGAVLSLVRQILPGVGRIEVQLQERQGGAHAPAAAHNPDVEQVREIFNGEIVQRG